MSSSEYETVVVDGIQSRTVGSGEVLSDVLFDITADGAAMTVDLEGDSPALVNTGWLGKNDYGGAEPEVDSFIHAKTSGETLIDTVYLGDGSVKGHTCPIFVNRNTTGSVTIRHTNIQQHPDNGVYASAVAKEGDAGETHCRNCYFRSCVSGMYRLPNGSMDNCVVVNDTQPPPKLREKDRGPNKPKGSEVDGVRGLWARNGANVSVNECVFYMPHETTNAYIDADSDGSSVSVSGSLFGPDGYEGNSDGDISFSDCGPYSPGDPLPGESETTSSGGTAVADGGGVPAPTGVPLTATEAAEGTASADGRTVPPGGTYTDGTTGGTTGGTTVSGVDESRVTECEFVEFDSAGAGFVGTAGGTTGTSGTQDYPTSVSGEVAPGESVTYNFAGEFSIAALDPVDGPTILIDGEAISIQEYLADGAGGTSQ